MTPFIKKVFEVILSRLGTIILIFVCVIGYVVSYNYGRVNSGISDRLVLRERSEISAADRKTIHERLLVLEKLHGIPVKEPYVNISTNH
jgi:hypothetical protein